MDLNVESYGIFAVKRVEGGTYDNVTLWAHSSGSIHVLGDLKVTNKLTIIADHSATILLPHTVTCDVLDLSSKYSSNVNSDDLRVITSCKLTALKASTASLYMDLKCPLSGSVLESSTINVWVHWPDGRKTVDVAVDGWSVFGIRDWSGK